MTRICFLLALAAVTSFGAIAPKTDCASMKDKTIPASAIGLSTKGAVITGATPMPEYCDLTGSISPVDPKAPPILFRITVPTEWNQESWHIGGGGTNGVVPMTAIARLQSAPPSAPALVSQGFAVYGSDSGHQGGFGARGGPAPSNDWIVNQESWMNFSYEQLKKTHDVAMQTLTMMYGVKAKFSYFAGTSQGGREGLEVVSRYPADYDGVYSTVPLAYFAGLLIDPTVKGVTQLAPGAWLPPAKSNIIHDEILRLCDSLDGAADGIINNYVGCQKKIDPSITKDPFVKLRCTGGADTGSDCLSDGQLATLGSFYAPEKFGYKLANGETDWPGWGAGMEGRGWLTSNSQPDVNNPAGFNGGIGAAVQKGRIGFSQDFNLLTLDFAKFRKQIEALSDQLDVREDWSAYLKKGGKLIMVTAASDYISNPRAQQRLYDRVVARNGKAGVDKSVRYYVMPNVGHGMTGTNAKGEQLPAFWDAAAALIDWVEKGTTPPDSITLSGGTATRLMCRYPEYPGFSGTGYHCVAP